MHISLPADVIHMCTQPFSYKGRGHSYAQVCTRPSFHTGRAHHCTQVCTHPSLKQAEAKAVWHVHTCTPRAVPLQPSPLLQPRVSFCNSCISRAALCIGRSFQNTSGLFTKLCKNILSPLQRGLPQEAGTCLAQCWASCVIANSAPGLLKGQLGTPQKRTVGLGHRPAGQFLPPQWLLAPHTRSLVRWNIKGPEPGNQPRSCSWAVGCEGDHWLVISTVRLEARHRLCQRHMPVLPSSLYTW